MKLFDGQLYKEVRRTEMKNERRAAD